MNIKVRDDGDWDLELQRLRRIRVAALGDASRSEEWKQAVNTCFDAIQLLLMSSSDGDATAVQGVRERFKKLSGPNGKGSKP